MTDLWPRDAIISEMDWFDGSMTDRKQIGSGTVRVELGLFRLEVYLNIYRGISRARQKCKEGCKARQKDMYGKVRKESRNSRFETRHMYAILYRPWKKNIRAANAPIKYF